MTRSIVDTMVLIHASQSVADATTEDAKRTRNIARALLEPMESIRVTTISWTEFVPTLTPVARSRNSDLLAKLDVVAFDPPAAREAERLIVAYRERPKLCRKCYCVATDVPCTKCGLHVSRQFRLNDIYIVATAATDPDTDVLYSFDGGILYFADKISGCQIERPPSVNGPLFERAEDVADVIDIDRGGKKA